MYKVNKILKLLLNSFTVANFETVCYNTLSTDGLVRKFMYMAFFIESLFFSVHFMVKLLVEMRQASLQNRLILQL